jgi:hypothetical protein
MVIFFPEIISIEDFIQDIAGIRTVDPIELLFEFYDVYLSVTEKQTNSHLNCLPIGQNTLAGF